MALGGCVRGYIEVCKGRKWSGERLTSFPRPVGGFWVYGSSDTNRTYCSGFISRMLDKYTCCCLFRCLIKKIIKEFTTSVEF